MRLSWQQNPRGTVSLVALCFVSALAFALGSYLAVCSRAMNLSNRSFQTALSQQLAEFGLEEGLRAFNQNHWGDWSNGITADWTLDATNHRATATLTFPAAKFGQGVTASAKIRVDNYDAAQLTAGWNAATTYQVNEVVGYGGAWFRCVQSNSSQTPSATGSLSYWVPAPMPWTWSGDITYSQYQTVNYSGTWYRNINSGSTTGIAVSNTSYWVPIPHISLGWSSSISYPFGSIVCYSGGWYYSHRRTGSGTAVPTDTGYWAPIVDADGDESSSSSNTYLTGDTFYEGDYIYRAGTGWLRCVATSPYAYGSGDYSDTDKWVAAKPFLSCMYRSSSATYRFNDVVYYYATSVSNWYRWKASTAGNALPSSGSWENALSGSWSWSNSADYNLHDVVYRNGSFYRCIRAHTNQGPPNTTYWSVDPLRSTAWDSGKSYQLHDTVRYNGSWYLSLQSSNLGKNPGANAAYWAIAPRSLSAWDSTRNYSVDDLVSSGGAWYRCIKDTTTSQATNNTTYWIAMTGAAYQWSPTATYTGSSYVNYGGVWYDCILAPTDRQSPNNPTYWTALGTPVVYAEGVIDIAGSGSVKSQSRAVLAPAPLFPNAIAATNTVSIGSGSGTVDSYDSSLGAYASPGGYSAVIASTYSTSTAVTIAGTTAVQGYLAAPWGTTAPRYSTGGAVKGANTPGTTTIDLNRISRSPYVPQFGIQGAIQHLALPDLTTLNLGTPGAPTPSIYYDTAPFPGATTVNINGPVVWYVDGNFRLKAGDKINVNSPGSLTVYLTGDNSGCLRVESGSGGIINRSPSSANPDPKNLVILGDTSDNGTQYYSYTTNPFYGVIYLPNTTTTTGLTIASGATIYGALSATKITFSAGANFHYDTSLRHATFTGVDQPHEIAEWRILPVTEQATLP